MVKTIRTLIIVGTLLVLVLAACKPGATPTIAPTSTPTPVPTASTPETPTGPVVIATPAEPGQCYLNPMSKVDVTPVGPDDHVKGATNPTIIIYEYSDFQCPGCAGMAPIVKEFLRTHAQVQLVYRHFPLSFHQNAFLAAEAAEAAAAQGKFWEMHDKLFNDNTWKSMEPAEARKQMSVYAKELELDVAKFDAALDNHTYKARVERDLNEAQLLQLQGTPSFIVNGVVYPFDMPLSYDGLASFLRIIDLQARHYAAPPAQTLDMAKTYRATLKTSKGDVVIEFFNASAPTQVNNFLFLAREGWYNGNTFFLVRKDFVAVSGDPSDSGYGYPGYFCVGETNSTFDRAGLVGMLPNGQFFITLGTQANQLSNEFSLIGQVVSGLENLQAMDERIPGDGSMTAADYIESVTISEK